MADWTDEMAPTGTIDEREQMESIPVLQCSNDTIDRVHELIELGLGVDSPAIGLSDDELRDLLGDDLDALAEAVCEDGGDDADAVPAAPPRRDRAQPRTAAATGTPCTCLRCGHSWNTRGTLLPKCCPSCVSAYWSIPPTRRRALTPGDPRLAQRRSKDRARTNAHRRQRRLEERIAKLTGELRHLTDATTTTDTPTVAPAPATAATPIIPPPTPVLPPPPGLWICDLHSLTLSTGMPCPQCAVAFHLPPPPRLPE